MVMTTTTMLLLLMMMMMVVVVMVKMNITINDPLCHPLASSQTSMTHNCIN